MSPITILTRQVSIQAFIFKSFRNLLRFLRTLLKTGIADFDVFAYYGHTAVTKSLVYGLRETNATFNVNPLFEKEVGEIVFVLSDVRALKDAIEWKKSGKIKTLLAGPNLVEIPAGSNDIISAPEIDLVLVSSDMSVNIYQTINPALSGRVVAWYAGVDSEYWKPKGEKKDKEVMVYFKNAPKAFLHEIELILKKNGYTINRIVYGHYSRSHFKKILERSLFGVFLSITETQGIALAECWSMNVPTLVWDPEIEHYYLRGVKTTAAPYLRQENGLRFKELKDLHLLLQDGNLNLSSFSPRQWVLDNMTNKRSAELFLDICHNVKK